MGIGDWGLGIGDWPIPNPQSPIPKRLIYYFLKSPVVVTENFI
jgi:hypothetical protein